MTSDIWAWWEPDTDIVLGELTWDDIGEIVKAKERGELRGTVAFWDALGNEVNFRQRVGYRERKLIRRL